ncbi:MAG: YicC/YloC family endoribonuclease [Pyrinomonadaceae bacterium]
MTGFGRGSATGENFSVAIELKTVNNRFLDVHLRAGSDFAVIEAALKKRITARLSRGRVDAQISIDRTVETGYELNRALIKGYLAALDALQRDFNLGGEADVNSVLRLPGVMQPVRDSVPQDLVDGALKALDQALNELEDMRAQEGAALAHEMHSRLDTIERQAEIIETNSERQVEAYRARLQKRINELLQREATVITVELDQGRLAQEVAYLADRSDISEEITGCEATPTNFARRLMKITKLASVWIFLLQELNREANTILSKATDLEIKEAGLVLKTEIEKLREQVQNVE